MNIKKYIIFIAFTFILLMPIKVNALNVESFQIFNNVKVMDNNYTYNESDWNLCTNPESLKTFRFIGNILKVAFIVIPILLIIMGSIDFLKATAANKEDDIKKAQSVFVKRLLAAAIVFLVPVIVGVLLNILNVTETNCFTCVLNPNSCNVP